MSNSLIEFTKNMSGIDLVKYVLNCIDENMILYSLLSMTEINSKINVIKDNFRVIYNIENIDEDNKRKLYEMFSMSKSMYMYNNLYNVSIQATDNLFSIITIKEESNL